MSGNVDIVKDESGMVANVGYRPSHWNRVASSFRSIVISISSSVATIFTFVSLSTSVHVDGVISKSGMAEKVGLKMESRRHLLAFKSFFSFLVW